MAAFSFNARAWTLYREPVRRAGRVSTLIEWDDRIPSFKDLMAEAERARFAQAEVLRTDAAA